MIKICSKCKQEKSFDEFHKDESRKDNRDSYCKECQKERHRKYHEANRDKIKKRKRQWREVNPGYDRQRRQQIRKAIFNHFGNECINCGSTEDLQLDHVNGDGKEHRKEMGLERNAGINFYRRLMQQHFDTDGYELQVLCKPCHIEKTKNEHKGTEAC